MPAPVRERTTPADDLDTAGPRAAPPCSSPPLHTRARGEHPGAVRRAGQPSWRVSLDTPSPLHLALFVRDAFRVDERTAPPTAEAPGPLPGVPDLRPEYAGPVPTLAAWTSWWLDFLASERGAIALRPGDEALLEDQHRATMLRHGLADGPDFDSLVDAPDLQRAARLAFQAFHAWWNGGPESNATPGPRGLRGAKGRLVGVLGAHPLLVTETVARIEAEIGRTAAPFDFAVEVLLTAGPDVLTQDATSAIVSSALVADSSRFAAWLDETLRPLA